MRVDFYLKPEDAPQTCFFMSANWQKTDSLREKGIIVIQLGISATVESIYASAESIEVFLQTHASWETLQDSLLPSGWKEVSPPARYH